MPSGIAIADFIWSTPVCLLILLTFVLNCVLSAWRLLPFSVIGILMPGILAREIDRQGFFDAFLAIATTTLLRR